MKKLWLLAFTLCLLVGSIGFAGTKEPSAGPEAFLTMAEPGDYTTCMNYCMNDGHDHDFEYCHGICKSVAGSS